MIYKNEFFLIKKYRSIFVRQKQKRDFIKTFRYAFVRQKQRRDFIKTFRSILYGK